MSEQGRAPHDIDVWYIQHRRDIGHDGGVDVTSAEMLESDYPAGRCHCDRGYHESETGAETCLVSEMIRHARRTAEQEQHDPLGNRVIWRVNPRYVGPAGKRFRYTLVDTPELDALDPEPAVSARGPA